MPVLGSLTNDAKTLGEVLHRQATAVPERALFSFLTYRGGEAPLRSSLNYRDLMARATSIAKRFTPVANHGDRVLIVCAPGLDFICAFFACQLVGAIAVPAYPPRNAKHMGRLRGIVADAGAAVVLVSEAVEAKLRAFSDQDDRFPPIVIIDDSAPSHCDEWLCPSVQPDDIAFLQYTSGTVGAAKGVIVTHKQVMANIRRIVEVFSLDHNTKGVFWLPPHHDMGLIGAILTMVVCCGRGVLMAPEAFLQRPLRWLQALSAERATVTTAPNFGWQLCIDAVPDDVPGELDLSSLRFALSGAEPVLATTLAAFSKKFERYGFRERAMTPVYGLAEAVLLTTCSDVDGIPTAIDVDTGSLMRGALDVSAKHAIGANFDPETDRTLKRAVSCGRVLRGHQLAIVDPDTRLQCTSGRVGEIWLSGPSVASGYWRQPSQTQEIFGARIADAPEGGSWLRTGDLGSVVHGELYVLGRSKEVIILRGRNYYAQDLELTAQASDPSLGNGRTIAFSFDQAGVERVVIAHEFTRTAMRSANPDQIAAVIRRAILETHDIDISAVLFLKPAQLPRTTSGKIQRAKIRQAFEAGSLDTVSEWYPGAARPGSGSDRSSSNADRLIDWLREFAESTLDSRAMDESRMLSGDVMRALCGAGFLGLAIPEELGGLSLSCRDTKRVFEQLAAVDTTLSVFVGGAACIATRPILRHARPPLRETLLRRIASGSALPALALTEPGAGSDLRALSTVARSDGEKHWRITGQKSWIGSGSIADAIVVICQVLDHEGDSIGPAAFVVPGSAFGVTKQHDVATMGLRGMVQSNLLFEDVLVGEDVLLGQVGDGFEVAQDALSFGHLTLAFSAVGGMQRCLQLMHRYAARRVIGTGLLLDNLVTRTRMTTLIAKTEALDALLTHSAGILDTGEVLPSELYSILKIGAEFHWEAADLLCQTLGGRGYDEGNLAPQILRDTSVLRIFAGLTEVHQALIGLPLLRGQSALPNYLSRHLNAPKQAESIRQVVAEMIATGADPHGSDAVAFAPVLADFALYACLSAALSNADDQGEAEKSNLLGEIERLESVARAQALDCVGTRDALGGSGITAWVDQQASIIGDVEQRGGKALDPHLQRDPTALMALDHSRAMAPDQISDPFFRPDLV